MENNGKTLIVLLIVAVLVVIGGYLFYDYNREDISVVPDAFDEAPDANNDQNNDSDTNNEWVFATTDEYTFQYPENLGLEYVELTDWPPSVEFTDDAFACEEAGAETDRAGRTESVTIGGNEYCRTTIVEGAAGSTYTQYAYAFDYEDGTAIMTMSTRAPQCDNYEGDEVTACEEEIENLNIDDLVGRMADTLVRVETGE